MKQKKLQTIISLLSISTVLFFSGCFSTQKKNSTPESRWVNSMVYQVSVFTHCNKKIKNCNLIDLKKKSIRKAKFTAINDFNSQFKKKHKKAVFDLDSSVALINKYGKLKEEKCNAQKGCEILFEIKHPNLQNKVSNLRFK